MEYLVEVQWLDPVGRAVGEILAGLPAGVESVTNAVPPGLHKGFTVLRSEDPETLGTIVRAVSTVGARVRITADGRLVASLRMPGTVGDPRASVQGTRPEDAAPRPAA